MDVAILGGGYAGLGAALKLGRNGVATTVVEAAPAAGGLGACTTVDGLSIERTYHHLKYEDTWFTDLATEVGLGDRVRWTDTRMGYYTGGNMYGLSTKIDLLRFAPLPFIDRIRFGLGVLKAARTDGRTLDGMGAEEWIIRTWGRTVYERLMKPMLLNKFGMPPEKISAAFLQGRIKGLSTAKQKGGGEKMGYVIGSNQIVTDRLLAEVEKHATIRTRSPIRRIERGPQGFTLTTDDGTLQARYVINTLPTITFMEIDKNFPFHSDIEYQGAINCIFALKHMPTPFYWINILDPGISFRIVVNQGLLFDHPNPIVYCGNYISPSEPLFQKSNEEIYEIYKADLERIFGPMQVVDYSVFRTKFATPIFDKDFGRKVTGIDEQVPDMIFAGHVKVYPGTRTLSSALRTGYEAADEIMRRRGAMRAAAE